MTRRMSLTCISTFLCLQGTVFLFNTRHFSFPISVFHYLPISLILLFFSLSLLSKFFIHVFFFHWQYRKVWFLLGISIRTSDIFCYCFSSISSYSLPFLNVHFLHFSFPSPGSSTTRKHTHWEFWWAAISKYEICVHWRFWKAAATERER